MKKFIILIIVLIASSNAFSQASSTYKVSQSESDEIKLFLRKFKNQCKEENNYASCEIFFHFPLKLEIYDKFYDANTWADLNNDIKAELCALSRLLPDNFEFDSEVKMNSYTFKVKYVKETDIFKVLFDFDDEDWTCEELHIKRIDGKFFIYKFSAFSLLDFF